MAYTTQAQSSFTVVDELGVKGAITAYALVDPTSTVAQVAADWQTMAGLIDAITGGQILHGKMSIVQTPSGTKGAPVAGSRVEQTGVFNFSNTANSRRFGEDIVSIADSVITSGRIDLTNTDVAALVTALHTATGHTEYTTNQFLILSALADAFLSFRKHRRALRAVSFEL